MAADPVTSDVEATSTHSNAMASPVWLAGLKGPEGLHVRQDNSVARPLEPVSELSLSRYPPPLKAPATDDPEIAAVMRQIDWSLVPKTAPRHKDAASGDLDIKHYDTQADPDCWWSSSLCTRPKLDYLPEDVRHCPQAGDWGLNYDDGPFRVWSEDAEQQAWQEPRLYNFLAEHGNQKATLFCK